MSSVQTLFLSLLPGLGLQGNVSFCLYWYSQDIVWYKNSQKKQFWEQCDSNLSQQKVFPVWSPDTFMFRVIIQPGEPSNLQHVITVGRYWYQSSHKRNSAIILLCDSILSETCMCKNSGSSVIQLAPCGHWRLLYQGNLARRLKALCPIDKESWWHVRNPLHKSNAK